MSAIFPMNCVVSRKLEYLCKELLINDQKAMNEINIICNDKMKTNEHMHRFHTAGFDSCVLWLLLHKLIKSYQNISNSQQKVSATNKK